VQDAAGSRAVVWVSGRRRHAETLAPAIDHALGQCGVGLRDLTAIAVDVGPGLFTGLRVGVTTAKGLAQGLGVGVVTVGSLEVLARAAFDAGHPGTVLALVDARRGEVFAARYARPVGTGPGQPLEPPRAVAPGDLVRELSGEPAGSILAVGDGALRYAEALGALPAVRVAGLSLGAPPVDVLVTLAAERLRAGAAAIAPGLVVPDYRRGPDVRINWRHRGGPGGVDPGGPGAGAPLAGTPDVGAPGAAPHAAGAAGAAAPER
jgi:tRNA threonylcarbamoyladenosine biosynthesis protein TsaB